MFGGSSRRCSTSLQLECGTSLRRMMETRFTSLYRGQSYFQSPGYMAHIASSIPVVWCLANVARSVIILILRPWFPSPYHLIVYHVESLIHAHTPSSHPPDSFIAHYILCCNFWSVRLFLDRHRVVAWRMNCFGALRVLVVCEARRVKSFRRWR